MFEDSCCFKVFSHTSHISLWVYLCGLFMFCKYFLRFPWYYADGWVYELPIWVVKNITRSFDYALNVWTWNSYCFLCISCHDDNIPWCKFKVPYVLDVHTDVAQCLVNEVTKRKQELGMIFDYDITLVNSIAGLHEIHYFHCFELYSLVICCQWSIETLH